MALNGISCVAVLRPTKDYYDGESSDRGVDGGLEVYHRREMFRVVSLLGGRA